MALSLSSNYFPFFPPIPHPKNPQFPISTLNPIPQPSRPPLLLTCRATSRSRSQSSPANKNNATKTNRKRKKRTEPDSSFKDFEIVREDGENFYNDLSDDDFEEPSFPSSSSNYVSGSRGSRSLATTTTAMPKPPAGFVVDETGRIVLVSDKRVATIVDSTNNCPLECIIRRVFRSSQGDECMLLCPLDTPVQILKSTNVDGWSAVNDDEVEAILPAAAYALAKIHMHLVHSGFCYTARGGFCYSEDDIFDFRTDDGQSIDGLPSEGVEITCFHLDGAHYMIYTPSDPLLFVAVKDQNGLLQIANDDLLEDPAIIDAIDEETEFNALVEEEAALLESLMGKR